MDERYVTVTRRKTRAHVLKLILRGNLFVQGLTRYEETCTISYHSEALLLLVGAITLDATRAAQACLLTFAFGYNGNLIV